MILVYCRKVELLFGCLKREHSDHIALSVMSYLNISTFAFTRHGRGQHETDMLIKTVFYIVLNIEAGECAANRRRVDRLT